MAADFFSFDAISAPFDVEETSNVSAFEDFDRASFGTVLYPGVRIYSLDFL